MKRCDKRTRKAHSNAWGFPYGRRLLDRSHSSVLQARYGDIGHGFTMPVPLYRSARANDINLCSTSGWVKDYVGYQDGHNDEHLAFGMSSSDNPEEFTWFETTHKNPIEEMRHFWMSIPWHSRMVEPCWHRSTNNSPLLFRRWLMNMICNRPKSKLLKDHTV